MSSPGSRKAPAPSQKAPVKQAPKSDSPWCLTCGVNLALDGRTFTVLSRHHHGDLCDMFSTVLGVEFSEHYPSVNLCNRCERQLRRLGRYSSIVLARQEGQKLRDQLEKNLAKHGSAVVEFGEAELDTQIVSPSESPTRRQVQDGLVSGTRSGVSSRSPSSKGRRPEAAIEEDTEPSLEQENRSSSPKKHGSPPFGITRKDSPPYKEVPGGSRSRQAKWSPTGAAPDDPQLTSPAAKKFVTKARGIALIKRAAVPAWDASASVQKSNVSKQRSKKETVAATSKTKRSPKKENTSAKTTLAEEGDMTSSTDKTPLVEMNESLEITQDGLQYLDQNSAEKEIEESMEATEQSTHETCAPGHHVTTNGEKGQEDEENDQWSRRVNPFDESQLTESSEFVETIENLDSAQAKRKAAMGRSISQQADEELFDNVDPGKFHESSHGSTSESESEDNVDPCDFNADTRSSVSEVGQRINIKSQFKGAYYNIGSTEDLLSELASEQEAEEAKLARLKSSRQKGKLSQYESLDLDIEKSNPFFDDVFGEFNRRVASKPKPKGTTVTWATPESITEVDHASPEEEITSKTWESAEPVPLCTRSITIIRTSSSPGEVEVIHDPTIVKYEIRLQGSPENDLREWEETAEATTPVSAPASDPPKDSSADTKADSSPPADPGKTADGDPAKDKVNGVTMEKIEPGLDIITSKEVVTFTFGKVGNREDDDFQTPADGTPTSGDKLERNPLLHNEKDDKSKFKDQQPGFLCCVVL